MALINFICPDTGDHVTSAINRHGEPIHALESVICPCCERFHVLDTVRRVVVRSVDMTPHNLSNFHHWQRAMRPAWDKDPASSASP
ncbi:MAG: hypothetical protein JO055_03570 [Alphaproteobacteria bacterium]|nr:hypothetical protein [Alphaproteobacteria bacterium]